MKRLWIISLSLVTFSGLFAQAQSANICEGFQPTEVKVDGQKVMRYNVSKGDLLRCLPAQPSTPWVVTKAAWSESDEIAWQNFVRSIGIALEQGRCSSVDTCLVSSANPYRDETDIRGTHFSDCADLPMYLRAYFAYKNQLPFTFGIGLKANAATPQQLADIQAKVDRAQANYNQAYSQGLSEEQMLKLQDDLSKLQQQQQDLLNPTDLRYTRNGNYFTSRINVPASNGAARTFFGVARQINDQYSSGSLRMLLTPAGQTQADFYPPAINKKGIVIGTVAYKPTGHVSIVYDITPQGDVKLMDAHPDNSMTKLTYSREYMRSLPTHGAGFKNWRPVRIENPVVDRRGVITAGRTVLTPNEQIPTFSLEQYFGNIDMNNASSKDAKWVVAGRSVDWYEYVKIKMANGSYKLDPLVQFKSDMGALCGDLQGRADSVETALQAIGGGLHREAHPSQLPRNIYGADGDWEAYSTPGRDLRIRVRAADIINNAKTYMGKLQSRDPFFHYAGTNLKRDLIKIYNEVASSCVISYTNSNGQKINLGLGVALKRLTSMSFDPYFCPERRWGAVSRAELKSCADDTEKSEWYRFQQFLRNATERDPNEVMGWSLSDLKELDRRGAVDNSNRSGEYDIQKKLSEL